MLQNFPIDPNLPLDRLKQQIEDSQGKKLLFCSKLFFLLQHVDKFPDDVNVIGCCWSKDGNSFCLNSQIFGTFIGLKPNSVNRNLRQHNFDFVSTQTYDLVVDFTSLNDSKNWRIRHNVLYSFTRTTPLTLIDQIPCSQPERSPYISPLPSPQIPNNSYHILNNIPNLNNNLITNFNNNVTSAFPHLNNNLNNLNNINNLNNLNNINNLNNLNNLNQLPPINFKNKYPYFPTNLIHLLEHQNNLNDEESPKKIHDLLSRVNYSTEWRTNFLSRSTEDWLNILSSIDPNSFPLQLSTDVFVEKIISFSPLQSDLNETQAFIIKENIEYLFSAEIFSSQVSSLTSIADFMHLELSFGFLDILVQSISKITNFNNPFPQVSFYSWFQPSLDKTVSALTLNSDMDGSWLIRRSSSCPNQYKVMKKSSFSIMQSQPFQELTIEFNPLEDIGSQFSIIDSSGVKSTSYHFLPGLLQNELKLYLSDRKDHTHLLSEMVKPVTTREFTKEDEIHYDFSPTSSQQFSDFC